MSSWNSLNHQVRWDIVDELQAAGPALGSAGLAQLLRDIDDGQPWFWQQWLCLSDAERLASIITARSKMASGAL